MLFHTCTLCALFALYLHFICILSSYVFSYTSLSLLNSINNTLNPDWVKTFTINHDPMGQAYFVNVNVLDFESNDKIMGMTTFQLESILSNEGNTRTFNLLNGGMLHVRAEKAIGTGTLVLRMSGVKLKNTEGIFRKSDPFYQLVRRDMGEK